MKNIAIITARGGSKRIPKKNIKEFCGKPIIAYSIEAAINSGVYDEVMVSTDSEEIAKIAKKYGAKVPFLRSEATSNDFATTRDVLIEVVDEYKKLGKSFDIMTCIYPTAPFVTAEKLKNAVENLVKSDADWLMPVVAYSFPPQRAVVIRNGSLEYQYPEFKNTRSQDLEPIYHDCGQFYVYRLDVFTGEKEGTGKILPLDMPEEETQDIDNMSDWAIAEIKYQKFIENK
ncbi:MAG: pseudaminic acid cytidylyltransferase [Ruminococcaceae bacterium]|nr:pseudaminic acid cytidylyltransferase [Oscillospiraceae bacterium]